jgi:hypothetical protein
MVIKDLINKSWYGTIGYIGSQQDIDTLEQYIIYNKTVLDEFKNIIVATNFKELNFLLMDTYTQMWKRYFKDCIIINSEINRGHNHGCADLDNLVVDYCKENNINWLVKSANDTIFLESFLTNEIEDADFYYLNGIGVGGMVQYNFDFDRIIKEDFYPQTNFYIINVDKIDYLNDKSYLNETYNYIQSIRDYNGRIWEYIKNWSCEDFLKNCITRNNLSKHHLIPLNKYHILLQHVKDNIVHDCSHKNVLIEGVCHLHYKDQPMLSI